MKVWFNLKDSALITALRVISTILESATSVTLLVRTALDLTLTNVLPAMKQEYYLLRTALALKIALILSVLTRINFYVTHVIALAKLVQGLPHHSVQLVWII
jgi:hypothetical protein